MRMNVSKIDSDKKLNCKIAASSLLTGGCIGAISMTLGNVKPKDIFQYGNLSKQQKNVAKISGIGALLITVLTALNLKTMNNNKKDKN